MNNVKAVVMEVVCFLVVAVILVLNRLDTNYPSVYPEV